MKPQAYKAFEQYKKLHHFIHKDFEKNVSEFILYEEKNNKLNLKLK